MLSQQFGVLNVFARALLRVPENLPWLTNARMAMLSVILVTLWKIFPFYSLVVLTAFQTLEAELYEAAKIDGAGALACFRHITIPGIAPTLGLMTLLATIFSFRRFTVIYLLTGGGPADATKTLVFSVYEQRLPVLRSVLRQHHRGGRARGDPRDGRRLLRGSAAAGGRGTEAGRGRPLRRLASGSTPTGGRRGLRGGPLSRLLDAPHRAPSDAGHDHVSAGPPPPQHPMERVQRAFQTVPIARGSATRSSSLQG